MITLERKTPKKVQPPTAEETIVSLELAMVEIYEQLLALQGGAE